MENKYLLKKVIKIVQLFELFNKKSFEGEYSGLNINEVHTIDYIGKNKDPKLTNIATYLKITRGGATKITKRLINGNYICSYQSVVNKKEKYFKLTKQGDIIFEKHRLKHENSLENDAKLFVQFNEVEKEVICKFLDTLELDLKQKLK